ncbi:MAG: hypothetical protein CR997_00410 [Acidobacteria bacterium]|nr:MAG: hypothetical protein CR997_00410 [Acidobacteriota bacterium]
MLYSLFLLILSQTPGVSKTTLITDTDPSIRYHVTGNSGNIIFKAAPSSGSQSGTIETDYQEGNGFVAFDRDQQEVTAEFKKKFSFNHLSKAIRSAAPVMNVQAPVGSTVDFRLKLVDLGIGQFDFSHLNVSHLEIDARFGEVYIDCPTVNKRIIRETAHIHLTAGQLDINGLANLKAKKWWINGGIGELNLNMGNKMLCSTDIKLDLDIGELNLVIPRGTKVEIRGTNRELESYGFIPHENGWIAAEYHQSSPLLTIYLLGPLGDLNIQWK